MSYPRESGAKRIYAFLWCVSVSALSLLLLTPGFVGSLATQAQQGPTDRGRVREEVAAAKQRGDKAFTLASPEIFPTGITTVDQVLAEYSVILVEPWVNRIKWIMRGVSCLAPPALGCLWGFFGTMIAEAALSEMAESCWFRREVMYPVLRAIDFIKQLPGRIADFVLQFLIDLLPGKAKELIGDVSKKEVELNDADACKDLEEEEPVPPPKYLTASKDPTPEQLEYVRLLQKWEGREGNPIAALGELLRESGISPNMAMSMERLKRIDKFLENINGDAQAIRNYIKSLEKGVFKKPSLEQVLDYAERSIRQRQPNVILEAPSPKRPTPSDERRRREGIIILEW